jgi:hypothetical protein
MSPLDMGPLLITLKAYRSNDTAQFKTSIPEMDKAYGRVVRKRLCEHLALLALEAKNAEMMKAILAVHKGEILWQFHREFDRLKHEEGHQEIIDIVESSGFQSMVPRGQRFSDIHPLDYL